MRLVVCSDIVVIASEARALVTSGACPGNYKLVAGGSLSWLRCFVRMACAGDFIMRFWLSIIIDTIAIDIVAINCGIPYR